MYLSQSILIYILQLVTLYKAMMQGWQVKKIKKNTYEITKTLDDVDQFNFHHFMTSIVSYDL